jgi:uncharacterized protein YgbK (DUF1537 family)
MTTPAPGCARCCVPWCVSDGEVPLGLLLKSDNFGHPDLLVRAMDGAS